MALSPPNPPLADHVVSLRPLAAHDLPAVEQALDDPEITHWFDNRGLSASDVIERAVSRWKRSEAAEFAILDGGECVGSMWLDLSPSDRAGVGYWLLPRARGKGLGTCALQLLTQWAFDDVGVKRISLLADPRNTASIAVAERVGFQREGVLRSWTDVNGERVDQVSFSLLPTDLS